MLHGLGGAFVLMVICMIMVFLMLWLVVIIGGLMIKLSNKYMPAAIIETQKNGISASIPADIMAAIVAAVDIVTGGKGKVTNIEKDNQR